MKLSTAVMGSIKDKDNWENGTKGQQVKKIVYSLEQEMNSVSFNVLHRIVDEMKKKEKVLEQVLDQTKHIRESVHKIMDQKEDEIESLKISVGDIIEDVKILKGQVEDMTQVKASLNKMKQEITKVKILLKLQGDKQKENENSRSLLEWHRHLDQQQKQQKVCKACRREAKQRYKAHRSQEW